MQTRARRVVVVVFDEVDLLDVAGPLEVFSRAGRRWNFRPFKVELVADRAGLVSSRGQLRFEATSELSSARPPEIVVMPGGYGARQFAEIPGRVEELHRLAAGAELLAGIGAGLFPLARAGLLAGCRVATEPDSAKALCDLEAALTTDTEANVVESERVFSARGSGGAVELALGIVRRTLGLKFCAPLAAELGIELSRGSERLEIRY